MVRPRRRRRRAGRRSRIGRMRTRAPVRSIVALLAAACLVPGCAALAPQTRPGSRPYLTSTDPCAMRLHEVCGALLLYYNAHHALPPTVAAIEQVPGAGEVGDMTCPVSHKPYIYIPAGVATAPGSPERVVLYDAEPAHGGMRLGIVILPPT